MNEPLPEWEQDLHGARVVIVGTGPSLDRIDAEYFKDFDVAILINFAVCRADSVARRYYYTTDFPRLIQLRANASADFSAVGRERAIFLNHLTPFSLELISCASYVNVVAGDRYRLNLWDPGRRFLRRRVFQVQPASDDAIRAWLRGSSLFRSPNVPGTSAFGAILFAARFRPRSINLIGINLNAGRSKEFRGALGEADFSRAKLDYFRLESLICEAGVSVSNDSWLY